MTNSKILIVEDFASIRDYLSNYLSTKGYQTLGAENGKVALEYLKNQEVDLVISDYNMPEMNGFELLQAMHADAKLSTIPMILLTSETSIDKMKAARELGLFSWVVKPYKVTNFLSTIDRALSRERVSS